MMKKKIIDISLWIYSIQKQCKHAIDNIIEFVMLEVSKYNFIEVIDKIARTKSMNTKHFV